MEQQKQRIVRTEEQILALLDEYDKSGFSVKDFCDLSDISDATFYAWQKKYRNKPEEEAKGSRTDETGFAKLEVTPTFIQSRPQLFAEIGKIKLYKEVPAEYLKTLLL